jgi:hypothetical protein
VTARIKSFFRANPRALNAPVIYVDKKPTSEDVPEVISLGEESKGSKK